MKRYAVIGKPVAHSRSPWLHHYFARLTQRQIVYAAYQPESSFADCARNFFANGGDGLNITVPYKAEALAFADSASAFAKKAGAANVLKRKNGGICAYNTDGGGLRRDLQRLVGGVEGKKVLLLGAGGAARAAAFALSEEKPAILWIYNRTAARAAQLASACNATALTALPVTADIVINATSAGHNEAVHYPPDLFTATTLAYDMSYGAAACGFLSQAVAGGARQTADGSGMLAWQAALSFAIWEGVLPSVQAAIAHLKN